MYFNSGNELTPTEKFIEKYFTTGVKHWKETNTQLILSNYNKLKVEYDLIDKDYLLNWVKENFSDENHSTYTYEVLWWRHVADYVRFIRGDKCQFYYTHPNDNLKIHHSITQD